MIVRAPDFALRDLSGDALPAEVKHVAHVAVLVAKVVELQHQDVGLAAIDARMREQIFAEPPTVIRA